MPLTLLNYLSNLFSLILALLFSCQALAALTVELTTDQLEAGKPLELFLETDLLTANEPDFRRLSPDFEWLDTQTVTVSRYRTGEKKTWLRWVIRLKPLRSGALVIPPIQVGGNTTAALQIQIAEATHVKSQSTPEPSMRISLSADKPEAYVGEQILVTLELLMPTGDFIVEEVLTPALIGATLRQATEPAITEMENGVESYQRLTRQFLMFASKAGELTLPGLTVKGSDPEGQPLEYKTNDLVVLIRPPAFTSQRNIWLPAQKLSLTDSWDRPAQLEVNSVILRTLTLNVTGVPATALPKLMPLLQPENGRVELVDLQLNDRFQDNQLIGERKEVIRIYPAAQGVLTLAAIDLPWWNITLDQTQNALLPSYTLQIAGVTQAQQVRAASEPPATESTRAKPLVEETSPSSYRYWLFGGLLLLSISSALVLFIRLRTPRPPLPDASADVKTFDRTETLETYEFPQPQPTTVSERPDLFPDNVPSLSHRQPQTPEENAFEALLIACELNDAQSARYSLLNWSQLFWQTEPPQSLEEIGLRARNQALNLMIMELEQLLYSGQTRRWNGQRLKEGLNRFRQQITKG
ncbi:BatD family protein [Neptuniibacter sp. CAU 1671]|nr:BatD family protein [Neptuniibacter sp. CAU 1671]